jgi:hypothetical protein
MRRLLESAVGAAPRAAARPPPSPPLRRRAGGGLYQPSGTSRRRAAAAGPPLARVATAALEQAARRLGGGRRATSGARIAPYMSTEAVRHALAAGRHRACVPPPASAHPLRSRPSPRRGSGVKQRAAACRVLSFLSARAAVIASRHMRHAPRVSGLCARRLTRPVPRPLAGVVTYGAGPGEQRPPLPPVLCRPPLQPPHVAYARGCRRRRTPLPPPLRPAEAAAGGRTTARTSDVVAQRRRGRPATPQPRSRARFRPTC